MGLFGKENLMVYDDEGFVSYYSSEDYDRVISLFELWLMEHDNYGYDCDVIDDYSDGFK